MATLKRVPTQSVIVLGLWHLGTVSAACLSNYIPVTAIDTDKKTIDDLLAGEAPIFEPGLNKLIQANQRSGQLRFQHIGSPLPNSRYLWVAFDTPIDAQGHAQPEKVLSVLHKLIPRLTKRTCIILHTQLPVGTTKALEDKYPGHDFCYIPENLRLGTAIHNFLQADRYIVGVRNDATFKQVRRLLAPLNLPTDRMRPESAELSKHALNSFLATSIVFANEVGTICPKVGASASEVMRALQSDRRIGPQSYLRPGPAFSGGTLARDVNTLERLARSTSVGTGYLVRSIAKSNREHANWSIHEVKKLVPPNGTVLVIGLVYKPGTNTLRGSQSVKLAHELKKAGFNVLCYDPALSDIDSKDGIKLLPSLKSLEGIQACVAGNIRPDLLRQINWAQLYRRKNPPLFFDAGGTFAGVLGDKPTYRTPFTTPN